METPESFLWAGVIARSCGVAADGARVILIELHGTARRG
jgi:hypothetical protein